MAVAIDEAGQQRPPPQLHDPGPGAGQTPDISVAAGGQDAAAPGGQRGDDVVGGVDGVYAASDEDQIGVVVHGRVGYRACLPTSGSRPIVAPCSAGRSITTITSPSPTTWHALPTLARRCSTRSGSARHGPRTASFAISTSSGLGTSCISTAR